MQYAHITPFEIRVLAFLNKTERYVHYNQIHFQCLTLHLTGVYTVHINRLCHVHSFTSLENV